MMNFRAARLLFPNKNHHLTFSSVAFTADYSIKAGKLLTPNKIFARCKSNIHNQDVRLSTINNRYLILDRIRERVQNGELVKDLMQEKAAVKLSSLYHTVQKYLEHINGSVGDEENKKANLKLPNRIPRGMYIYGDVGTGKSLLMDTLYNEFRRTTENETIFRRVHFHTFMADVHARIHALKKKDLRELGRNFHVDTSEANNPIIRVGMQLSKETKILCFDEFQVTDIADALILSQLFAVLFSNGTVCIATSNRPPDDLYEGGINRSYFIPFIDMLKKYCIVYDMNSPIDYRKYIADGVDDFFFVGNESKSYYQFLKKIEQTSNFREINFSIAYNRFINLSKADIEKNICMLSFDNLCKVDLGASDYNTIAAKFKVVIIVDIPTLSVKEHDQARRFITLVDELYESRCAVACYATAKPEDLFEKDPPKATPLNEDIDLEAEEILGIDVAQSTGRSVGELASVRELRFAFRRAGSRLTEMCSKEWWRKQTSQIDFDDLEA